jgi:tetratricopeptide (TPR) repeat protein
MKKAALILIASVALTIACNNKDKEKEAPPSAKINREKLLVDSVAKFPDSLVIKEKLIQYYRDSGYYDKALSSADNFLKTDSLNTRLWDIKAILHFENGDTVNAIRSFEKAVSIVPAPDYMISLGSLYAQSRNRRALTVADLLLKDKNADAGKEALFIKGLYYNYTGDKAQAISFFDKCLSMEYTFMFAYREKAIALYDLGKYEEALKVLTKAVTLQNNFDEGYYWRGRCLEKLGKFDEAIDEYRTALVYSPDYTEAREALVRLGGE